MDRTKVLAKMDALPDHALVEARRQTGSGWQAGIALCDDQGQPSRGYLGDPCVMVGHETREGAVLRAAERIRELARGTIPSSYELWYRLIPFWEKRAVLPQGDEICA